MEHGTASEPVLIECIHIHSEVKASSEFIVVASQWRPRPKGKGKRNAQLNFRNSPSRLNPPMAPAKRQPLNPRQPQPLQLTHSVENTSLSRLSELLFMETG